MAGYDSYVICTSPRSGSTLLCKLLAATGVSGNPQSYFHRPSVSDWLARLDIPPDSEVPERDVLAAVFKAAIAEGSLDTGMFGLRLQRHSFDFFTGKLAVLYPAHSGDVERFRAAFGKTLFIHLTREDKVEQAVSYAKAERTGLWHVASDGTEVERLAPHREPIYDGAEIRACFEAMTTYDRDWEGWFAEQAIEPLRVSYDALSRNPNGILRLILDRLGLDCSAADSVIPGVAKMADETSREWVARFRREASISQAPTATRPPT